MKDGGIMQARKALGKGLASLIPTEAVMVSNEKGSEVDIDLIIPNRMQPRHDFSEDALENLANSIKQKGIIQPLVVAPPVSGRYELIAGERRLRAAKMAGLARVPVVVKEVNAESMLELALIENIQRENLNPIEEALAYQELIDEFGYTQDEVSEKLSKSRPHIANTLRLLQLPKVVQEDVIVGRLTAGHARALLVITDIQELLRIRESILQGGLSVREVETLIQDRTKKDGRIAKNKKKRVELSPQMTAVIEELTQELGTKVRVNPTKNNKGGHIVIQYYSLQDFNRIFTRIIEK